MLYNVVSLYTILYIWISWYNIILLIKKLDNIYINIAHIFTTAGNKLYNKGKNLKKKITICARTKLSNCFEFNTVIHLATANQVSD